MATQRRVAMPPGARRPRLSGRVAAFYSCPPRRPCPILAAVPPMKDNRYVPAVTLPSVLASVLALLATAVLVQYAEVLVRIAYPAEHTLAIPAIVVFLAISLLGGGFYLIRRRQLLTRPELLCVLYSLLLGTPLMTQAFWHRIVAITATIPRTGDFKKIDAFSDKLWPHGENLIADGFAAAHRGDLQAKGSVVWQDVEYEEGKVAGLPVFENTAAGQVATLTFKLPLKAEGKPVVKPGEPYMVSVLVRPDGLGPDSECFCRLYDSTFVTYTEAFSSKAPSEVTFLHKKGFVRIGRYNFLLPSKPGDEVYLQFGLTGPGRVAMTDPKLFSVGALEFAYKGKLVVLQSEYDRLGEEERANLIPKPESLLSLAGAKYFAAAYIPWGDWAQPLFTWFSFVLIILAATFAVNVIMRKQWVENERYPLPITKIPVALMGLDDERDGAMPVLWRNKMMWAGLGVSLAWCLLRGWHFYDSQVPDTRIWVPLKPLLGDPSWGQAWDNVTFSVHAIFLSLAIFMELNVLLSLTIGFLLFHLQWWVGEFTGLNATANYPFVNEQQTGAYFSYALLLVFFSRKYLWNVIRQALARSPAQNGEPLSYRAAFGLLLAAAAGIMLWARWIDVSSWGMLAMLFFILCVCFVAAKFRAECGTPYGYFGPWNAALFLFFIGGVTLFGSGTILVALTASFFLCETVFFLIPGAQFELIELGRRVRVVPRHILYIAALGVLGGLFFGGWVFLSNAYSVGGETVRYTWAFETKWWYYFVYNTEMVGATRKYIREQGTGNREQGAATTAGTGKADSGPEPKASTAAEAQQGVEPATYAYLFGAAVTVILTVLRQAYAGFWFHPMGFIVGMTRMMDYVWGSILAALVIRFTVLWLGGAATIRHRLQPFFIGVFIGGILAAVVFGGIAGYLYHIDIAEFFGTMEDSIP